MTKRKVRRFLHNPTVQLALAIGLFFISAIMVRDDHLFGWEIVVFNYVYGLPDSLSPFFMIATQFGSVVVLLTLSVIFLVKKHYNIVIRMLMAGLLAEILAHVGKALVGRPRPTEYLSDLVLRDPFITGPGFPSGHTAVATAVAIVIGSKLPKRWWWLTPVWIILVATSRMYLGVHAPMDLVGGFAIGLASVALFRHVRISDIRK